jgi:DNA modification methylase/ParB-like chromosome segregation protein Spo0J
MQLIAVDKIIIAKDRQRQEFDPQALAELGTTIASKGLMHALVVRESPEGFVLVAGERRLRAIIDLWMLGGQFHYNSQPVPEGFVPYVTLGQLSPLEAEEAELEENLHRKDLSWQERASAMARLHKLRSQQAQALGKLHTVADTAMEVKGRSDGSFQDQVRKDIIVANHLHNPEIAKAKTTEEAFKILKRQETSAKNVALAEAVGRTFQASIHEVHNVNCLDWLRVCPAERFDVILTDPPYGMGAEAFGDAGEGRLANHSHHYEDSHESWQELMRRWCPESFRVTKPQAHAYVFCDFDRFHELKALMQAAGWYVFRTPILHTKPNSGRVPLPDEGPRRQYECILYAIKGHKKTTAIYPDIIATTADMGLQHGAQKPVALYENLLMRSVRPGDEVLDSFGGTGTLIPAAHAKKCKATVLEASKEYYGVCLQRLKDVEEADRNPPVTTGKALGDELAALMGL